MNLESKALLSYMNTLLFLIESKRDICLGGCGQITSWWFQPEKYYLVKLHHFPNFRDKHKRYLKPPTWSSSASSKHFTPTPHASPMHATSEGLGSLTRTKTFQWFSVGWGPCYFLVAWDITWILLGSWYWNLLIYNAYVYYILYIYSYVSRT